jgi:hypothetical protein
LGLRAFPPDTAGAGAGGTVVGVRVDTLAQIHHLRLSPSARSASAATGGMRCIITPRASPTIARDARRSVRASRCDQRVPQAGAHRGWRRLRVAADGKDARRTGASTWPLGDLSAASDLSPASTACLRLSKSAGAIVRLAIGRLSSGLSCTMVPSQVETSVCSPADHIPLSVCVSLIANVPPR